MNFSQELLAKHLLIFCLCFQESDEEESDQSERNSSPPVEHEPVAMEGDAISVCSRASTNECEAQSSPSPETIDFPEHTCAAGKFPARKVVDGETCARVGLPFVANYKAKVIVDENKLNNEKKLKEKKKEVGCSGNKNLLAMFFLVIYEYLKSQK